MVVGVSRCNTMKNGDVFVDQCITYVITYVSLCRLLNFDSCRFCSDLYSLFLFVKDDSCICQFYYLVVDRSGYTVQFLDSAHTYVMLHVSDSEKQQL